jgi:hypothetical protein
MARITAGGLDLLKKMDKPVEEFHRKLLGQMGEKQLHTLLRLLEQAREIAG